MLNLQVTHPTPVPQLLLASFLMTGMLSTVAHADDEDEKSDAADHFEKGVELFKNDDFEGALVEFKAAYESSPHYSVRYNVGICLYKLHRYAEAQVELTAYLEEGGEEISEINLAEVQEALDDMAALVGTLKINCEIDGAQIYLDGEFAASLPSPNPLRLNVGEYNVEVKAEGYVTLVTKILIPGGTVKILDVELEEAPEPEDAGNVAPITVPVYVPVVTPPQDEGGKKRVHQGLFWTALTLTVLSAGGATATGVLAKKSYESYAPLTYWDKWESEQWKGERLTLTTNILWGVTGAMGLVTFIVAFVTDFKKKEKKEVAFQPVFTVDTEEAVLGLEGVF